MKKEYGHITDDLLVKYLAGEAEAAEQEQVREWLSASEENQRYYDHFALIWDKSKQLAAVSTVSEEDAWERFKKRAEQANEKPTPRVIEMQPRQMNWMRVAALLLLLVGGGWLVYNFANRPAEMIALHSADGVLIETLPDGSVVTLNKASTLRYAANFEGKTRDVELEGEAFFNVTPNKDKPFIIKANDATVRVVGTSFNVKSNTEKTVVIVETGVVEVKKAANSVHLNPNEKATVLKSEAAPLKEKNEDALYNYYRTKEFECNGTPLWRLVDVLNEAYNVNIVIDNARIKNLELTTTFRNEPIEVILEVISKTLGVQVDRNGNNIYLK